MIKNEIVVTGGLGFIGRNFIKYLDKKLRKCKIIILDKSKKNLKRFNLKSKNNKIIIIISKTIDIERKLSTYKKIHTIFHFGEFSRIVPSFTYTNECFSSNTIGTYKVLKFCADNKIKFIYSASSSRFGNYGKDENLSPYSWTKSKNIELIKNFNIWYGLKYEIVYFYNVYGDDHSRYDKLSAVIGIFEGQYLKNKPLTLVLPGNQTRDFTHVDDIVRGTYLAWKKNLNRDYLLGTGKKYSIKYIAKLFNHKIKLVPSQPGERLSSSKINRDAFRILNYKPQKKIEDHIKNFIKKNGK